MINFEIEHTSVLKRVSLFIQYLYSAPVMLGICSAIGCCRHLFRRFSPLILVFDSKVLSLFWILLLVLKVALYGWAWCSVSMIFVNK